MKMTYKLMLTGLFIVVTMISCEENTGSAPNSIKYFHSTGYGRINCCPTQCGEWYAVSFSDDAPSGWYWLGLTRQGSLRYVGRGKFFDDPNTANYDTLFYHYFGGLDSGDYELQLFRCNSRLDVGKPNNSLSRGGPETVAIEQGYTSWPCAISDCEYSLSDGYLPHDADFGPPDVIGVIGRDWGPDEWGIWYDRDGGSDLLIWDVFPLATEGKSTPQNSPHNTTIGSK